MTPVEGVFARYKNGRPFAARVTLSIESPSSQPGILFRCSGEGWISQGYLEEVPAVGYDDWKAGAKAGIEYALAVAHPAAARVEVTRIVGMLTDTNPSVVGAAAALATWKALAFEPPSEVIQALEAVVFGSWERPHDAVPEFA
jgi:hypothetical protein